MTRGTIIVSGAIANKAGQGGEAWVRLHWLLGFRRLGFRVFFVEQLSSEPGKDAVGYFRDVMERFGFAESATLLGADGAALVGLPAVRLREIAHEADALINISGHLAFAPVLERVRRRVFVDIDPGFTQFWHADGNPGARLVGHDFFFTIGTRIGSPDCPIPTGGIHWRKVRPPVVLEAWSAPPRESFERFTTVASWRGPFGVVTFGERSFGLKVHEFRKVLDLPRLTGLPFEIALNIHLADHKDREALEHHGWRISDPHAAAGTPEAFVRYVKDSSAEFSVAQGIYVQTGSGWFSDRTAAYLAAGRPALVQDTGFSKELPTGAGLLAFRSLEEAAAGAQEIAANYARHCHAARELAEAHFDSDKVLSRLAEEIAL
jgi:hypothetical protein